MVAQIKAQITWAWVCARTRCVHAIHVEKARQERVYKQCEVTVTRCVPSCG
jgi:hypothetical protein